MIDDAIRNYIDKARTDPRRPAPGKILKAHALDLLKYALSHRAKQHTVYQRASHFYPEG